MKKEDIEYLKQLNEQDLTVLTLLPYGHRFVVHKNTQNKISHDIVGKGQKISEFLDYQQEEPGKVHLYADNFYSNKRLFTPDHFQSLADIERKQMEQYTEKTVFRENADS